MGSGADLGVEGRDLAVGDRHVLVLQHGFAGPPDAVGIPDRRCRCPRPTTARQSACRGRSRNPQVRRRAMAACDTARDRTLQQRHLASAVHAGDGDESWRQSGLYHLREAGQMADLGRSILIPPPRWVRRPARSVRPALARGRRRIGVLQRASLPICGRGRDFGHPPMPRSYRPSDAAHAARTARSGPPPVRLSGTSRYNGCRTSDSSGTARSDACSEVRAPRHRAMSN